MPQLWQEAHFKMLQACDKTWAKSFLELQRTNILYTEYDGLHLFRQPLVDGYIMYGHGEYRSIEPSSVSDLIASGSRLRVHGKHEVAIYRGSDRIGLVEGDNVGMCSFY
jgi:hypothetical protein